MSYIDIGRHELCGQSGRLPLYHPEVDYTDPLDFQATPANLVLGGGSGEHPAAAADPVSCLLSFLLSYSDIFDPQDENHHAFLVEAGAAVNVTAETIDHLYNKLEEASDATPRDCINFSAWGSEEWVRVYTNAQHGSLIQDFDPAKGRLEHWIADCIGEYTLVAMPELVAGYLIDDIAATNTLNALGQFVGRNPMFGGVVAYPTGYEVGGRGDTMSDYNMRH